MMICICRRLNETAVREAVRAGAHCPDTVQAHHGCQFNCGKCKPAMAEVVACEQQRQTSELPLVAAE